MQMESLGVQARGAAILGDHDPLSTLIEPRSLSSSNALPDASLLT